MLKLEKEGVVTQTSGQKMGTSLNTVSYEN